MNPKIGVALSGGGARALAHIGVLQVFQKHQLPIHYLSGTSMGGLVAAAYASGMEMEALKEEAIRKTQLSELIKLVDLLPPRRGLMEGNRVREYLQELIGEQLTFNDLLIPLALNAVDLTSGQEVTFTKGELLPVVFASLCMPGLFTPLQYQDYQLVDGGILNNLPISNARDLGADFVIAVDAQIDPTLTHSQQNMPPKPDWPIPAPSFFWDFYWAQFIMVSKITHLQLDRFPPDVLIRPAVPPEITMFFGFNQAASIIEAGAAAAEEAIPEILTQIS